MYLYVFASVDVCSSTVLVYLYVLPVSVCTVSINMHTVYSMHIALFASIEIAPINKLKGLLFIA